MNDVKTVLVIFAISLFSLQRKLRNLQLFSFRASMILQRAFGNCKCASTYATMIFIESEAALKFQSFLFAEFHKCLLFDTKIQDTLHKLGIIENTIKIFIEILN